MTLKKSFFWNSNTLWAVIQFAAHSKYHIIFFSGWYSWWSCYSSLCYFYSVFSPSSCVAWLFFLVSLILLISGYFSIKITVHCELVVEVLAKILVTCREYLYFAILVNGSFEQDQAYNAFLCWNNALNWYKIFDPQTCTDGCADNS